MKRDDIIKDAIEENFSEQLVSYYKQPTQKNCFFFFFKEKTHVKAQYVEF